VISTAIKKGKAEPAWIAAAIHSMTTLNKAAAEVIAGTSGARDAHVGTAALGRPVERGPANDQRPTTNDAFRIHALTDVTGFGLIGHAREVALASNVSLRFFANKIPLLEGALDCVRAGHIPGGLNNNRAFAECMVQYDDGVPEEIKALLFDPQTAGGLLISTPNGPALTKALTANGVPAVQIGEVLRHAMPGIQVLR
jgi:selenide,water dikinase